MSPKLTQVDCFEVNCSVLSVHVYFLNVQSLVVTHWNVYGRPALDIAVQKVLTFFTYSDVINALLIMGLIFIWL